MWQYSQLVEVWQFSGFFCASHSLADVAVESCEGCRASTFPHHMASAICETRCRSEFGFSFYDCDGIVRTNPGDGTDKKNVLGGG